MILNCFGTSKGIISVSVSIITIIMIIIIITIILIIIIIIIIILIKIIKIMFLLKKLVIMQCYEEHIVFCSYVL